MIEAIIWDYDGTLVDTRQKNLHVTREIIRDVLATPWHVFPALTTLENYESANSSSANWRDLYTREFGMTTAQTDQAGLLWTKYQLADSTPVSFYQGLHETITELGRHYPQGIVSLNSQQNIRQNLLQHGLDPFFREIIGYEEVSFSQQKPDPAALVKCITALGLERTNGKIVYIGDHETDAHCAVNANRHFGKQRVFSIGALYEKNNSTETWNYVPDHIASHTMEITQIIRKLLYAEK